MGEELTGDPLGSRGVPGAPQPHGTASPTPAVLPCCEFVGFTLKELLSPPRSWQGIEQSLVPPDTDPAHGEEECPHGQ